MIIYVSIRVSHIHISHVKYSLNEDFEVIIYTEKLFTTNIMGFHASLWQLTYGQFEYKVNQWKAFK